MHHVFVSIWPVNTLEVTANLPLDQKLSMLGAALKLGVANMATAAARMGVSEPLLVFVAPEYLFIKGMRPVPGHPPQADLYTENERDRILDGLRGIGKSQGSRHLLLIPGTILWKKPRTAPIMEMARSRTWDGFNIAPVILGGELKHVYTKKFDDQLCLKNTPDVHFVRGTDSALFNVKRLWCGLEVCGDFGEKNLATEAQGKMLDLEFYISATNPHIFENQAIAAIPVKNGGYFIHCDANGVTDRNGVWVIERNRGSHGLAVRPSSNEVLYDPWTRTAIGSDVSGLNFASSVALQTATIIGTQLAKRPVAPSRALDLGADDDAAAVPRQGNRRRLSLDLGNARPAAVAPVAPAVQPDLMLRTVGLRPTQPLSPAGAYQATMEVRLIDLAAANAPVPNRAVRFTTDHGAITPGTVFTGNDGSARAVLSANIAQKSTISATCLGATVSSSIEYVKLGNGNVSLLGRLQGTPYGEIPSWYLPVI